MGNITLTQLHQKLIPQLSLSAWDSAWNNLCSSALVFKPWLGLKSLGKRCALGPAANLLQSVSLWLVMLLPLLLPAPQFASGKEGLAVIVMCAFFLRMLGIILAGKEVYIATALDAVVLLFAGINVVAAFSSHYLGESLNGLAKLLVYICSYFLFVAVLQHSFVKRARVVVWSLLLAGAAIGLYGLYQYKIGVAPLATWEDPSVENKATRIYGTLRNPNLLAGYFVPMVPLAFATAIMHLSDRGWRRFLALPAVGIAFLIAVACFLTGSRGGYIGMLAGTFMVLVIVFGNFWSKQPKLRLPALIMLLGLPVLVGAAIHFGAPAIEERFLSIFAGREHSSNSYRLNVYASSWRMFLDNWWIGIGPGNQTFRLAYGLYMRSGFDALGTYCVPLEIAVEAGLSGLIIFAALLFVAAARAHQAFWDSRNGTVRWLAAGAFAALVALMAHGLVDTVFYRPQVQLIFWLMLAIAVCAAQNRQEPLEKI